MIHLLQINPTDTGASSYLPIALQVAMAVGLIAVLTVATHFLGPKRKTSRQIAELFERY
ncbi:MAG: hypothetical protein NVV59_14440 [Chitinophagaceae bacterium]|nr:hypothetical protein [Chitinophagaceae bacterium]